MNNINNIIFNIKENNKNINPNTLNLITKMYNEYNTIVRKKIEENDFNISIFNKKFVKDKLRTSDELPLHLSETDFKKRNKDFKKNYNKVGQMLAEYENLFGANRFYSQGDFNNYFEGINGNIEDRNSKEIALYNLSEPVALNSIDDTYVSNFDGVNNGVSDTFQHTFKLINTNDLDFCPKNKKNIINKNV
jgi:hypothetical protein